MREVTDPSGASAHAPTIVATDDGGDGVAHELARGATIGRYVILEHIGQGGMGIVYAAFDPDLDRKVAVKLMFRTGGDHEASAGRERLLREARAMAKLSHPNVVAVHDVGVLGGQVFIAMEFVDGQTVRQWLSERSRTWREIVDLFRMAGKGLAEAHAADLVHRDFKPENVMIGRDGRVRVMDFGLARPLSEVESNALGDNLSTAERHELTRTGALVGTPAYMAPEQLRGSPPNERSDQFGFCVSFYEALFGHRPFEGETLGELIINVLGDTRRDEPPASKVPGWLRRVVERGLTADMDARFPSMTALVAELERDPSRARRRWAVAFAGVLVVGAAVGGVQFGRIGAGDTCEGASDRLAGVWDDATRTRVEAAFSSIASPLANETVGRVTATLDAYASTWARGHRDACEAHARGEQSGELLDKRMACLELGRRELAATVGILSEADASVVPHAVQATLGLRAPGNCADITLLSNETAPPADPQVAAEVDRLRAQLVEVKTRQHFGKLRESFELMTGIESAAEELGYLPLTAEVLYAVGRGLIDQGQYEKVEPTLRRAVTIALQAKREEVALGAAITLTRHVGYQLRRPEDGLFWGEYAQALLDRADPSGRQGARLATHLGDVLWAKGDYAETLAQYERAIELSRRVFGDDHPELATALSSRGDMFSQQGRVAEAIHDYQAALKIYEQVFGSRHPSIAVTLTNLAVAHAGSGKLELAVETHERAVGIAEESFGPNHPQLASMLGNLGEVQRRLGRLAQARVTLERAKSIVETTLGSDHPTMAYAHRALADLLVAEGRHHDAVEAHRKALEVREASLGASHPEVANTLAQLGRLLIVVNHPSEAVRHLERALTIAEANPEADPLMLAGTLEYLAHALLAIDRPKKAIVVLKRAEQLPPDFHPVGPVFHNMIQFHLAEARFALGQNRGANIQTARDCLAAIPTEGHAEKRREIESWLAEHG